MKKELTALGIIVCAALLIWLCFSVFPRISFRDVKEVRLYTYDHETREEVGLTDEEAREVIRLYNRSRHGGNDIFASPCCASYCVTIDLTDGSTIRVQEGVWDRVIVTRKGGRQHYLTNQALIDYILELAEQYNLPKP